MIYNIIYNQNIHNMVYQKWLNHLADYISIFAYPSTPLIISQAYYSPNNNIDYLFESISRPKIYWNHNPYIDIANAFICH